MPDQITFMQLVAEGMEDYRNNRTIPAEEVFVFLDKIIDGSAKK
jgi:hypothetical protein